jgi:hypothetical protein
MTEALTSLQSVEQLLHRAAQKRSLMPDDIFPTLAGVTVDLAARDPKMPKISPT